MNLVTTVTEAAQWYNNFSATSPHLCSMATAEVTFLTGDMVSQLIGDRHLDWRKLLYTGKLAPLLGLGIEGLIESGNWVGEHISDRAFDMAALGPNILGNIFNAWFFTNNTVGERTDYKLNEPFNHYWNACKEIDPLQGMRTLYETVKESFKENVIECIPKFDYEKSVLGSLVIWNGLQTFNYSIIPETLRTPASLTESVVWIAFLSLWSLKGRQKVTGQRNEQTSLLNTPIEEVPGRIHTYISEKRKKLYKKRQRST